MFQTTIAVGAVDTIDVDARILSFVRQAAFGLAAWPELKLPRETNAASLTTLGKTPYVTSGNIAVPYSRP